jgi:hypothetical protein
MIGGNHAMLQYSRQNSEGHRTAYGGGAGDMREMYAQMSSSCLPPIPRDLDPEVVRNRMRSLVMQLQEGMKPTADAGIRLAEPKTCITCMAAC